MKILLNTFPPANCKFPDTGLSVLKQYLIDRGYDCHVKYWNHILAGITSTYVVVREESDSLGVLIPYLYLLRGEEQVNGVNELMIKIMQHRQPILYLKDGNFNTALLKVIASQIVSKFDSISNKENIFFDYQLIGITYKFNQWIPGIIYLQLLRKKNPKIRTVIGGIPTREEAVTILSLYRDVIDYAIWGEGEDALFQLANYIDKQNVDIESIPSLVYQIEGEILYNKLHPNYTTIPSPNFDDFVVPKLSSEAKVYLEGSRGCSWKQCSFCFLNEGYKFRKRDIEDIIQDIRTVSNKYQMNVFSFTDNDFICGDIVRFNDLLDALVNYKKLENSNVEFQVAEINTFFITKETVQKAFNAGFKSLQIGFEALSDSLLIKMRKQSRFIHHLLAIKLCYRYGIEIDGANLIKDIPDETTEDIIDSINNLYFLRFLITKGFRLSIFPLSIRKTSKYYSFFRRNNRLGEWYSAYEPFVSSVLRQHKFVLFEHSSLINNLNWIYLESALNFYNTSVFTSVLHRDANGEYLYSEFINDSCLSQFALPRYSQQILEICDDQIVSISKIIEKLNLSSKIVLEVIEFLYTKRMVFWDREKELILSVVDI